MVWRPRLTVELSHDVILDYPMAGDPCSKSGKERRQCLALHLLFLFQYVHEAVNGPPCVVCLLVWSRKRHGKMAESVLLDHEVMPTPQIVLQGAQVRNQDGGVFAW